MSTIQKVNSVQIREVWNDNLEDEFDLIREIVDDYPYVAMGAYSLGSVIRPVGNCHYQIFKANVYKVKLFQLVLTFSDKAGTLPTCGTDKYCVWQFNFRKLGEDLSQNELIELLRQSRIDFKKNNEKGINEQNFADLLMSSGVVLNKDVNFVSFDGGSNFGYLVKLLKGKNLPETQPEFYSWAKTYLPTFYDIKHLMKFCDGLHEGLDLDKLAELLGEERIGNCCQAGSDSLLTSATFKKMKECFFNGSTEKYGGVLYGLGI